MDLTTIYYVVSPLIGAVLPLGLTYFMSPAKAIVVAKAIGKVLERAANTPGGIKAK